MMVVETWRVIPEFPDYSVSDLGRVRRDSPGKGARAGRILKLSPDANGYAVVSLSRNGEQTKVYVHHLVAFAFLGPREVGMQAAHWDGDGMNAAVANLRWATQSENEADKHRHGRANYAPRGSRTFPADVIPLLRQRVKGGESLRAIGRELGVAHTTVAHALRSFPTPTETPSR